MVEAELLVQVTAETAALVVYAKVAAGVALGVMQVELPVLAALAEFLVVVVAVAGRPMVFHLVLAALVVEVVALFTLGKDWYDKPIRYY